MYTHRNVHIITATHTGLNQVSKQVDKYNIISVKYENMENKLSRNGREGKTLTHNLWRFITQ